MPRKPKRPCSYPGCPKLVDGQYCEEHKRLVDKQYNEYGRDNFTKNFYKTPEWLHARKQHLNQHPFCAECLKAGKRTRATMVDHIVPIKQGGERFAPSNLQSLCWSCHSRKSAQEGSRWKPKPREYDRPPREGEVENLTISTLRAGPQSNAKKREIKNQTEKSKKSKPIRSIEGRATVLFDFAGNQNNQKNRAKIKNSKGRQYGKRWSKTGRGKTEESGHAKDTGRQSRQASDRSRELHNR